MACFAPCKARVNNTCRLNIQKRDRLTVEVGPFLIMNLMRAAVLMALLIRDIPIVSSLVKKTFFRTRLQASYSSFSRLLERLRSDGASLDTNLLATNPDLVISHLQSRRSNPGLLDDVAKIAALRTRRNLSIVKGDAAKGIRKNLSQQIGQLMKEGKTAEVMELKKKVEEASETSAATDADLEIIDAEINTLFSVLPNLLDDRSARIILDCIPRNL